MSFAAAALPAIVGLLILAAFWACPPCPMPTGEDDRDPVEDR